MGKALIGMGIAAESMASSLSYASSYGTGWLAVLAGLFVAMPAVHAWTETFVHGETAERFSWRAER